MTAWWLNEGGFPGILPGSNYGSGGGNAAASGAVQFRSPLDAARAASGQLPQAQYPDGYLGNITSRNSDKLLQNLQTRLTAQSYQRGVHKGSRIAPKEYFWPDGNVTPTAGLERESTGYRDGYVIMCPKQSPSGDPVEMLAHMGKTAGLATPGEIGRKMQEARDYGVNPAMNPIVLQDPQQQIHFSKDDAEVPISMSASECCNQQQLGKHVARVTRPNNFINYKGENEGPIETAASRGSKPVRETYAAKHYGGSRD